MSKVSRREKKSVYCKELWIDDKRDYEDACVLKEAKYKELRRMMSYDYIGEPGKRDCGILRQVGKCVKEWGMNVGDATEMRFDTQ